MVVLDRGEGSGITALACTRAVGGKQTMPWQGTCWTARVAVPRPPRGQRLRYRMKLWMDCAGYGRLGCGSNMWCRRCEEVAVPRSSTAGWRGRTRVSVIQERGSYMDAEYLART